MTHRALLAASVLAASLPVSASAQEFAIGLGYTDYASVGQDSGIFVLDYRHSSFFERNNMSAAVAASISTTEESDFYVGVGVGLRWSWENGWFVDFSLMPGYYDEGIPGNDLGHALEFRSLLGLGYTFDGGQSVSMAITHKSNASLDSVNPGADALLVRWHIPL